MSKELVFDGWWEGKEVFTCDNCGREKGFLFDSEDVGTKEHKAELRKQGWVFTQVNGLWKDFCCERCRNQYIRKNTI